MYTYIFIYIYIYIYGTLPFDLLRAGALPGAQKDTTTGTECSHAGGHSHSSSQRSSQSHSHSHSHS